MAFFGLGLTELFGGGGAVGRDLFLFFFVFRVFFLAFDVSGPPSVLVEGNYEAPAVFKHKGLLSVLLDRLLRSPMREFLRFLREKAREREGKERERGKSSPFFPLFQKNSGAGVSVKTSTTGIMGPYSPVAYDVGCRGDSYSPDGPCYGTLLAQQGLGDEGGDVRRRRAVSVGRGPVAVRREQPQDLWEQQAGVGAAFVRRFRVAAEDTEAGNE